MELSLSSRYLLFFLPGKCVPGRKKWNLVSLWSVKGEDCVQRVIPPSALGGANQPLERCLSLQTLQGRCKERSPDLSLIFSCLREGSWIPSQVRLCWELLCTETTQQPLVLVFVIPLLLLHLQTGNKWDHKHIHEIREIFWVILGWDTRRWTLVQQIFCNCAITWPSGFENDLWAVLVVMPWGQHLWNCLFFISHLRATAWVNVKNLMSLLGAILQ